MKEQRWGELPDLVEFGQDLTKSNRDLIGFEIETDTKRVNSGFQQAICSSVDYV